MVLCSIPPIERLFEQTPARFFSFFGTPDRGVFEFSERGVPMLSPSHRMSFSSFRLWLSVE